MTPRKFYFYTILISDLKFWFEILKKHIKMVAIDKFQLDLKNNDRDIVN